MRTMRLESIRHLITINVFILMLFTGSAHGAQFVRGDVDANEKLQITDGILILSWLFFSEGAIPCGDAADINDDGRIDLTDSVFILNYLFSGGQPPPAPQKCGWDSAVLGYDVIDCNSFPPCEKNWSYTSCACVESCYTSDQAPCKNGEPSIIVTNIPCCGSGEGHLSGYICNIDNADSVAITAYVRVCGKWFGPKPYWGAGRTRINQDYLWEINFRTGGRDPIADRIEIYLFASDFDPPDIGNPSGESLSPLVRFGQLVEGGQLLPPPLISANIVTRGCECK